ncbi:preprotein translocase subunit YajC [Xylocopilactobacillus apicola]|uniref:Preprotein translocase subunit YajC n=1 Tax=Xylocopilactobacillus apicola TaxID=2932184 RepID=A0AAU9D5P6_9LACO|nr:preprotein translocase subunit YajC [Xylocopilactobacillus apicola]BDR58843.1 hypothetical protein XA3_12840 [Xylocopilactobacillus apicola]
MKLNLMAAQQGAGGQTMYMLVLMIILFGAMYIFTVRPQKKKMAEQQDRLSKVKKGDEVITRSGLHGTVDSVDQAKRVFVLNANNIFLTFELGAIMEVKSVDKPEHLNTKDDTDSPEMGNVEEESDNEENDK